MSTPTALVVYASTHGHTARIAARLADALRERGAQVDQREVGGAADADPAAYDGVVVAASLHRGHHQREMVDWVKGRREALAGRPTLLVSVSLSAADDSEEARERVESCIADLVEKTAWTPGRTAAVAGALQYREYDVFTRVLIRLMMRHAGRPSDPSRDYDFTDWDAVRRLGTEFAAELAATRVP